MPSIPWKTHDLRISHPRRRRLDRAGKPSLPASQSPSPLAAHGEHPSAHRPPTGVRGRLAPGRHDSPAPSLGWSPYSACHAQSREGRPRAAAGTQLISSDPASPGSTSTPRILGAAEPGSTVRLYPGPGCAGALIATASAAALSSPGIAVEVAAATTSAFSATATDPAANTSPCSTPISYTHLQAPPPSCIVPKLKGSSLPEARSALAAAHCALGTVRSPKRKQHKKLPLVVKSSNPPTGQTLPAGRSVDLRLGPRPRKTHR